ncbi:MAG: hypothetical protein IJA65_02270, partial [Acholeplasmatales bacterium]|nr:hypothetical protein [Acholeplasmatales bacterium]
LDIIEEHINKLGFSKTENLYDIVLWPNTGVFTVSTLRINSNRQIYDIPYQEMKLLVNDLDLKGEALYRAILEYFGYEVLTEKANNYLKYVEGKSR